MDWLASIHRIRALKLEIARLDPRGGMPVAPPAGASAQAIAAAERRLGFALPPSYRALLAEHDGFPQLFAGASLLGARPLARGTYVALARMVLDPRAVGGSPAPSEPASSRRGRARAGAPAGLVPFGIDAQAETIFAWDPEVVRADGEIEVVLWLNEIGVRVESFPAFLELCADMLSAELDERRRRPELAPAPRAAATPEPPRSAVRPLTTARRAPRPVARIWASG